ncbi:MAG: DUF4251 domain-containing protein [Muribaculaceae bacterium]|nr:DUF4251 domain-containing protein [Muribaculaceae bacterium]
MKKILLSLSAMILMGLGATAQTVSDEVEIVTDENVKLEVITPAEPVKESKKEIKEREKKLRELNDDVAHAKASNSMRRGYFVLVADYIQFGRTAYRHYGINPNSNFVLIQGDDGIIQYALNGPYAGSNGLGGWTGKGNVRNKDYKEKDNGDVIFKCHLISGSVNTEVYITLYHNSNQAMARIMGSPEITIYGEILPYRDSEHR